MHILVYTMVCSQEMLVQNVVFVIFCRKPHMGFGHMVDVMVVWIPWAKCGWIH